MRIIGIDPSPTEVHYVIIDGDCIQNFGTVSSNDIKLLLSRTTLTNPKDFIVVCEMVKSYGMAVSASVFNTCLTIGRVIEACQSLCLNLKLVGRLDTKVALCHSARAKDSNVRAVLIDIWGGQGTRSSPGRTYGISGDRWAALAVATVERDGGTKEYVVQ